jgi:hypothetical protein
MYGFICAILFQINRQLNTNYISSAGGWLPLCNTFNIWRYKKLTVAGVFLSGYTLVEAGYNP